MGIIRSRTASGGPVGLKASTAKVASPPPFTASARTSAKFGRMPRSAIVAGSVDSVLPPEVIAREFGAHRPTPSQLVRLRHQRHEKPRRQLQFPVRIHRGRVWDRESLAGRLKEFC